MRLNFLFLQIISISHHSYDLIKTLLCGRTFYFFLVWKALVKFYNRIIIHKVYFIFIIQSMYSRQCVFVKLAYMEGCKIHIIGCANA